jgi:hypothetical protein
MIDFAEMWVGTGLLHKGLHLELESTSRDRAPPIKVDFLLTSSRYKSKK